MGHGIGHAGNLHPRIISRKQMTNLRIYAGSEHPHEAQEPEVLDVKSMNSKNTRVAV